MHMQFSEDSQHNYFFSQPHQPFFVLAFINAIVTMLIFMFSYKDNIFMDIADSHFHAYGFIYLLFTPAFFGFLFTTFPRFSSTPAIDKKRYMRVFSFYYMGSAFFLLGSMVSPILTALGMIIIISGQTMGTLILKNIYETTTMEDKHDIFWILLAMGFGLLAHVLFIIGEIFYPTLIKLSTDIAIYLYLFLLAFSVAQRMVPFFSHSMVAKNETLLKTLFILLTLHIISEVFVTHASFVFDLAIGVLLAKEFKRWGMPFPKENPLLWILHIAMYWSALAFVLSGLTNLTALITDSSFLALDIHILVLGFVLTILIGFGTRVTLGHSGNKMQADKWTVALFYTTQVVVVARLLTSLVAVFGWNFMILFNLSATLWIVLFLAWAVRYFSVLIKGKTLLS